MKSKRKRNRPFNKEDVQYIFENFKDKTATQLSKARGLSTYQVNRIVAALRKEGVDLPKKVRVSKNPIKAFLQDNPKIKKARKKRGPGRPAAKAK